VQASFVSTFPERLGLQRRSISVARNSPVEMSTWATPALVVSGRDRCEIVIFVRAQDSGIHRSARGYDAGDLAAESFLAGAGLLHLIANGDAVAAAGSGAQ